MSSCLQVAHLVIWAWIFISVSFLDNTKVPMQQIKNRSLSQVCCLFLGIMRMICAKIIAKNPIETAYHQHCRDIAWRTSRDTERSWAEFAWCLSVSFHVVERRFASCTQESETSKKRIARLESALQATGADETVLRKITDACLRKRMKGISCDVFGPLFHECLFLLFFNPASTINIVQ